MKTVEYWWKDTHINEWNRVKSPALDRHKNGHLIFYNEAKPIQWRKYFQQMAWEQNYIHMQKKRENLDLNLTAHSKTNKKTLQ